MNDTANFKVNEFACKCCGQNKIEQPVIEICQKVREELGQAIRVNSGYRCEKHNKEVGGVSGSNHTKGKAADLSCNDGAFKLFLAIHKLHSLGKLPELGYCILYVKKNFVHIDIAKRQSGNIWELRP